MAHTFQPVKRVPLYLKVYKAIEADILSHRLPEDTTLPTETELSEQLGVTRSSVREGIRLLEQAGLVGRGAGKRLVVKRPQAGDVAAAASKSLVHGGVTFREVWQALSTLYPRAAALAAESFEPSHVDDLRASVAGLDALAPSDHDAIVGAAFGFFQTLAVGLNNRVLLTMLQSLNLLIEASLARVIAKTPAAKKRIFEAQTQILNAIEAQDCGLAEQWMARHIDDLKRGYEVAGIDLTEPVDH